MTSKPILSALYTTRELATKFSICFVGKIPKLRDSIDGYPPHFQTVELLYYSVILLLKSSLMLPVELRMVLKSPSKSCDLDPIPTILLKQILESLLPVIMKIVNKFLQTRIFPDLYNISDPTHYQKTSH
ncbi:RNA-directed DNA polymerase from mobile element jockey [Oopsacas minuta]|uniref:RNA-directed DNA polymerase from mobile element jockey n=1 Tax=Oopsacas minuta TaxID=111878 RepID=A0AAV7KGV4_9METZ|nr:RNA-directed DNA polymerase from mobile element jockey [Oopsacas minuta]